MPYLFNHVDIKLVSMIQTLTQICPADQTVPALKLSEVGSL